MLGEDRSKTAFPTSSEECVREGKSLFESSESFLEARRKSEHLQITPDNPAGGKTWPVAQKKEMPAEPRQSEIRKSEPRQSVSKLPERDTSAPRLVAPEEAQTLRTHNLFFAAEDRSRKSASVLREVQVCLSREYSSPVAEDTIGEVKVQIHHFAGKYIQDRRIVVEGMTTDQLIDGIYSEMAEFGFLTRYIYGGDVEEIDVNAWGDMGIQCSEGIIEKLTEHSDSPEHAINVVRRMLHVSGMVLDDASPGVLGHLSKNIRIAVLENPIVDENVEVVTSIRAVSPQSTKKEDSIRGGTATGQTLDLLPECIRYGISICMVGATSFGKTTLFGWLLVTIPDGERIYSIENGSRELAPVCRDEKGRVRDSATHTLTRDGENERQRVDQIVLPDMALWFNPDVTVVDEVHGPEANTTQEATRTGVTVVTTIHSTSCDTTYQRIVSLCKRAVDMSDGTLMGFMTEAYPIVAFCKQFENEKRHLMEIMECEILAGDSRRFRPPFQYQTSENWIEDGRFIITGEHCQVSLISESPARRLMESGMPKEMLAKLRTIGKKGESL